MKKKSFLYQFFVFLFVYAKTGSLIDRNRALISGRIRSFREVNPEPNFLFFPRRVFDSLCPVESSRSRKRLCVILFTRESAEHEAYRQTMRQFVRDHNFSPVTSLYTHSIPYPTFFRSFRIQLRYGSDPLHCLYHSKAFGRLDKSLMGQMKLRITIRGKCKRRRFRAPCLQEDATCARGPFPPCVD